MYRMNFKAKAWIFSGIYAILGAFVAKRLFFLYEYGTGGINMLPINFFEMVLFLWAFIIVLITLITLFVLAKRARRRLSKKSKINLYISLFVAGIILFLLVQSSYYTVLLPVALILYGMILFRSWLVSKSNLLYLAMAEIILGTGMFIINPNQWLFLVVGFGILPLLYGMMQLKKTRGQ